MYSTPAILWWQCKPAVVIHKSWALVKLLQPEYSVCTKWVWANLEGGGEKQRIKDGGIKAGMQEPQEEEGGVGSECTDSLRDKRER